MSARDESLEQLSKGVFTYHLPIRQQLAAANERIAALTEEANTRDGEQAASSRQRAAEHAKAAWLIGIVEANAPKEHANWVALVLEGLRGSVGEGA